MFDSQHISRNDLVAIAYAIYTSLHDTVGKEPLLPDQFTANCKKSFEEFENCLD